MTQKVIFPLKIEIAINLICCLEVIWYDNIWSVVWDWQGLVKYSLPIILGSWLKNILLLTNFWKCYHKHMMHHMLKIPFFLWSSSIWNILLTSIFVCMPPSIEILSFLGGSDIKESCMNLALAYYLKPSSNVIFYM